MGLLLLSPIERDLGERELPHCVSHNFQKETIKKKKDSHTSIRE